MEKSTERREWGWDELEDAIGRFGRFGTLCYLGLYAGMHLVLQDLFIVYRPTPAAVAAKAKAYGGFCGRKQNVLGLDGLFVPSISFEASFFLANGFAAFFCSLACFLMLKNAERLRLLIWRSRRRLFHNALTGRVLAWVCVLSAFIFLINNTSICFGITAFNCLTTFLVGAVNYVAEPEDGIAMSRWVVEQSAVIAFLVAVCEGASAMDICGALLPVLAALWAILSHKITVLLATKQLQLPDYIARAYYIEGYSQHKPMSELDKSWAIDVEYQLENTNMSSSSLHSPLLQYS